MQDVVSIEDKTTKITKQLKNTYILLMGILFIGYIYLYFTGTEHNKVPMIFWIIRIVTAILAIFLGKLWNDKGFLLLAIYLSYKFFRLFLIEPISVFADESAEKLLAGLWICTGCYGMARIFNEKELKRFVHIISTLWIVGTTISSVIGIFAAWTDQTIQGIGTGGWLIYTNRLEVIYISTIAGCILCFSACIAFGYMLYGPRKARPFYLLAFIINMMALALTDSRTAILCSAIGIGLIIGISIIIWMNKRGLNDIFVVLIGILSSIVISIIVIGMISFFIPAFNYIKFRGGNIISSAFAETSETIKGIMDNRAFLSDGTLALNGRAEIWQMTFDYLKSNQSILLFGNSILGPLLTIRHVNYYAHVHNMLIQAIVENGIVGTLPLFIFLVLVAIRGTRTYYSKSTTIWQKIIFALIIAIWLGEMAECNTWFKSTQCPIGAVLFVAMGIITNRSKRMQL